MALTDLKSDLSKFRIPFKQKSIEETQGKHTSVVYSTKTPIDDKIDEVAKISLPKKTPVKSVVTPKPIDNTEKFKGQTTPDNFTFTPQFTTPKLGSVDFFPNTNADGFTTRMEKSRFNFSSLSSPKPMTLEGKFLGETDPNKMSLESKFLGETTLTPIDNTEKFKGETNPKPMTLEGKFLGETDPNKMSLESKFLGETTPPNFTFTPQFTNTTPSNFTFTPQFTTPTLKIVDFIPNTDAKGFTTNMKRTRSQFVDINRGQNTFTERIKNSKLGVVNFFPNDDAKGFTKNFDGATPSQFRGINISSNEFTSNKPTTKLRVVNFFPDDDAVGFTKNFVDKTKSQFTGINGETFVSRKVIFSGDFGLSFLPGNKIKLEGSAAKYYQVGSQKWQPGGKRYEDKYVSIGDLLISENSPSYLTKIYDQFNLKDDSFNPYPLLFRQPFILRGIQRKANSKKEPQKWGLGGDVDSIMGVDLIRGGLVTSTERALVDVARIGQFILSPKGIVWSIMQVGMQRTNTYNKVWTPLNLLLAVGGQHFGLHPKRHGLLDFGQTENGTYENIGTTGYKTELENIRNTSIFSLDKGEIAVLKSDKRGGWDSIYGINIAGPSTIRTSTNTFNNPEKTYGEQTAMTERGLPAFVQKYNPFFKTTPKSSFVLLSNPKPIRVVENPNPPLIQIPIAPGKRVIGSNDTFEDTYGKSVPITDDEKLKFGLTAKSYDEGKTPQSGYQQMWEGTADYTNLKKINGIEGEEVLSYAKIKGFADANGDDKIHKDSHHDFRTKYVSNKDENIGKKNKYRKQLRLNNKDELVTDEEFNNYYKSKNIKDHLGLGNSDTTIGIRDKIPDKEGKFEDNPDLIKLIFQTNSEAGKPTRIQFRGTVNSISETFSPNWTDIKYSGRAENAYIYDTFGRELNFGFRVYAYSVSELVPMWKRLEALGKMTMPTYIPGNGYHGNITKFTLGRMYVDFPALISTLQYSVLDEFTWEIGLNNGSNSNVLPMGVDVTIGLKLLNHELHKSDATKIYDYL